jgi:hypothetical protein
MFSLTKIEAAILDANANLSGSELENKLEQLDMYKLFLTKSLNGKWSDDDLDNTDKYYVCWLNILTDLLDGQILDSAQIVISHLGEPMIFFMFEIGNYRFACKYNLKYPGPSIFFIMSSNKEYAEFFSLVKPFCDEEDRFIHPFSLKPKTFTALREFVKAQLSGLPNPMCIPISDDNIAYLNGLRLKD